MSETGIVGRDPELARMRSVLADVVRGDGQVVVIEGEAGIGKTKLVQELSSLARSRDADVLSGRAEELEQRTPFGLIGDLLRTAGPSPVDEPGLQRSILSPPSDLHYVVGERALTILEELSARRPLLLIVEDLQWADAASVHVLHTLARHVSGFRILLVLTCRPVPRSPQLHRLLLDVVAAGAARIELDPLDPASIQNLAASTVGAAPGPALAEQLARAGGNALYVIELLRALERDGALRPGPEGVDIDAAASPPSLPLVLLHRFSVMSPEALDVLRTGSILGATFSVRELQAVLGRPASALRAPLEDALAAGVLEEHGSDLRFRHELIHDALYQDIASPIRRALHAEAAHALIAAGLPAWRVAEHVVRGAETGDADAVDLLREASKDLATRDPAAAVDVLDRAIDLAGPSAGGRVDLLVERAVALWWSGRLADAEAACRDLLSQPLDARSTGAVRLCLAQVLAAGGRLGDALSEIDDALGIDMIEETDRVRLLAWASWARMYSGHDFVRAEETAREARARAETLDDDLATCMSLITLASIAERRGRLAEALGLADRAVAVADRSPDGEAGRFPLHLFRGTFLTDLDRFDEADQAFERARRTAEDLGLKWVLPYYHWSRVVAGFWSGRWDDALAELDGARALAAEIGGPGASVYTHSVAALIALHRGNLTAAELRLEDARAETAASGRRIRQDWMLWAEALLHEANGGLKEAFEALLRAWRMCLDETELRELPIIAPDLVRLALAVGDDATAKEVTAALEAVAAGNRGVASIEASASRCIGLIGSDADVLLAAADLFTAGRRPLEAAVCFEDAAVLLGRRNAAAPARDAFARGADLYTQLGAMRDLDRAEARAREAGIRPGARGRRRRPTTGWDSLTDSERRVVALVAEGLTDREIAQRLYLSRHTVHTHVSHALAKLRLRSKIELAAAAVARGPRHEP